MDPIDANDPSSIPPIPADLVSVRTGTAASSVSARPDASRLTLIAVGAAGALAGVAFVLAFAWLQGDAPVQTASAAPATTSPAAATPGTAPVVEQGPTPEWTGRRTATWGADGSRTIAFELPALRDAPAWMATVRPVLVVQCLSRATRGFVALGTSAGFEDDAFHRTVHVQWDDDPMLVQQWQVSESGQELFAPDGVSFVRQLAKAKRLRFGFTPFNAEPITADFSVKGFDQLAGLVASTCGWRL